jgi:xanthine dehydrogenase accessory factor
MRPDTLKSLLAARAEKQQVALVSNLESGAQTLVFRDRTEGELALDADAITAARDALRDDKSGRLRTGDAPLFVQVFNPPKRFPGVTLSEDWPDDALNALAIDNRTAVVTLTHDPKLDDPALHAALRSEAFYVGSLGSKRTHAGRVERLTEAGYTEAEIGRIHAPVGLAINAKSPAEIAISIMAQITQVLHSA